MSNDTRAHILSLHDRWEDMTPIEQETVSQLHRLLREVKLTPRTDKYDAVQLIEDVEYTLQSLWGFPRDRDYHNHWIDISGCTCPKLDNSELMGAPYRVINQECPWHKQENPF